MKTGEKHLRKASSSEAEKVRVREEKIEEASKGMNPVRSQDKIVRQKASNKTGVL